MKSAQFKNRAVAILYSVLMLNYALFLFFFILPTPSFAQKVTILDDPRVANQASFDLLESATTELLVSSYVFREDEIGLAKAEILRQKALAGIPTYLLMDDFAAWGRLGSEVIECLTDAGVKVGLYNKLTLSKLLLFKYEKHRYHEKVVIVDGKEMTAGGRNTGKEYVGYKTDAWLDMDVHLEDKAAVTEARQHFLDLFASDAVAKSMPGKAAGTNSATKAKTLARMKGALAELQDSGFIEKKSTGKWRMKAADAKNIRYLSDDIVMKPGLDGTFREVIGLIDRAKFEIVVEVAYLVPTTELVEALQRAKDRHVRVVIMTNSAASNNQKSVNQHYELDSKRLRTIADEIWEYGGKETIHSKYFVIDRETVAITSANWNHRSQNRDFEVGVVFDSKSHANELLDIMDQRRHGATIVYAGGDVYRVPQCASMYHYFKSWLLQSHL